MFTFSFSYGLYRKVRQSTNVIQIQQNLLQSQNITLDDVFQKTIVLGV